MQRLAIALYVYVYQLLLFFSYLTYQRPTVLFCTLGVTRQSYVARKTVNLMEGMNKFLFTQVVNIILCENKFVERSLIECPLDLGMVHPLSMLAYASTRALERKWVTIDSIDSIVLKRSLELIELYRFFLLFDSSPREVCAWKIKYHTSTILLRTLEVCKQRQKLKLPRWSNIINLDRNSEVRSNICMPQA